MAGKDSGAGRRRGRVTDREKGNGATLFEYISGVLSVVSRCRSLCVVGHRRLRCPRELAMCRVQTPPLMWLRLGEGEVGKKKKIWSGS